ncbi:MAG: ABC transporter permease [Asgard group archaeon]|nr:ABC transporter permease [Asgard group archaeon]
MSIQHSIRVVFKGVWRDLKTYMRYRAFFTGMLLELISSVFAFAIIGGAYYFSPDVLTFIGLSEDDLFLFMMSGSIIQLFSSIATWAPLNRIEEDIHYGTLEAVFVTPSTRLGYLLSTSIARGIISFLFFIPLYVLTLWLAGVITNITVVGFTLMIAFLAIISNVSVGIYFGMIAIMYRQARLLISTTHQLIQFLFGAFLPVQGFMVLHEGFGTVMKYITLAFPFTYNFDLMRYYMFGEKYLTLLPIWQEFTILGSLIILYFIFARLLLIPVERKAKKQGLAIL